MNSSYSDRLHAGQLVLWHYPVLKCSTYLYTDLSDMYKVCYIYISSQVPVQIQPNSSPMQLFFTILCQRYSDLQCEVCRNDLVQNQNCTQCVCIEHMIMRFYCFKAAFHVALMHTHDKYLQCTVQPSCHINVM